jgi:hypothetical protein
MKTFQLILDSRTRTSNNAYDACFQLSKPISRVQSVRVKFAQFANTLFNIAPGENILTLSTGATLIIPPGFYTQTEFITLLQTICSVTYNSGKLIWTLGTVSIVTAATTMREVIGLSLNNTYTGTFSTWLYLASPMNVDFSCNEINDTQGYIVYSGRDRTINNQPFLSIPVTEGYGNMCFYSPHNMYNIKIGNGSLSQLDFFICDSSSGRLLTELSHWSMLLEVDCY